MRESHTPGRRSLDASGVYRIRNTVNGKCYIGSASVFKKRFREHRNLLEKGKHHSRHLQSAWNKYGNGAFVFEILEETEASREALMAREQYWIDTVKPAYNMCPRAYTRLGSRMPESAKILIGAAVRERFKTTVHHFKGRKLSPEHRAKMSAARIGKSRTRSAVLKGCETRRQTQANPEYVHPLKGVTPSLEHRINLSVANSGEKNYNSKLSACDVHAIRWFVAKGVPQSKIAKLYGIPQARVSDIKIGKGWKHVPWQDEWIREACQPRDYGIKAA